MKRILAVLCLLSMQAVATAAEGPHPWVVPAPRLVKETYFSNLQDGASIETPFLPVSYTHLTLPTILRV